jgi:hypothetical protein
MSMGIGGSAKTVIVTARSCGVGGSSDTRGRGSGAGRRAAALRLGVKKIGLGATDNRLKSADWIYLNNKQPKTIIGGAVSVGRIAKS